MLYKVLRIEEDIDYGCEERLPGSPVMAVVTLRDENENEQVIRWPDRALYDLNINEGDTVFYEPGRSLEKIG